MKERRINKLISFLLTLSFVIMLFPQMTFATPIAVNGEYITYRDFTQGITDDEIAGISNKRTGSDGLIVNNSGTSLASNGTDSLKMGLREVPSSVPQFQACLYYGNGAMDNSSVESFSESLELQGNIVLEAEMKFDTVENTTYYPLAIVPDTAIGSATQSNYTHEIISVKNGKCYIGGIEKGDIATDTYYKFMLVLNIDGNADTVDTFSAEVSAGNVAYTGEGNINNLKGGNATLQEYAKKMTSIAFINVVRGLTGDGAKDATTQEYDWVYANIKTLKIYNAAAPSVTTSIEDGETDVSEGSVITLTFDQKMKKSSLDNIKLLDKDNKEVSGFSVAPSSDYVFNVTLPPVLESEADYKLVIPSSVVSKYNISVEETVLNFKSAVSNFVGPIMTASIEDGETDVREGSIITLTFDQEMNTDTFNYIKLFDKNDSEVTGVSIDYPDGYTCVITLPDFLEGLSLYKLLIPDTVANPDGLGVAGVTINFTTAKSKLILDRDFTESGVTDDEVTAINTPKTGLNGLLVNSSATAETSFADGTSEETGLNVKMRLVSSSNPQFESSLYYGKGALNEAGGNFTESLDLKGNIVLEAEMKFDTVDVKAIGANSYSTTYYPLAIVPDSLLSKQHYYNFATNMIKIKDGRCYINDADVGEIKADTYYKFKLTLLIDGDANSTDTFRAEVTDGTVQYSGSGNIGAVKHQSLSAAELTSIAYINVLRAYPPGDGVAPHLDEEYVNADIKSLKFYYIESPSVVCSIEDGAENIEITQDIVLTFSEKMQAVDFGKIKLYKNGNLVDISVTPRNDLSDTCSIKVTDGLEYNRAYTLYVPAISNENNFFSESKEIKFVTKPKDPEVTSTAITVNDGGSLNLAGGETVKSAAYFTNETNTPQNASIIICVYNSANKLKKLAFAKQTLGANAMNVKVEATVIIPEDIGENAYIRTFALDSLENMNALADMVVLP